MNDLRAKRTLYKQQKKEINEHKHQVKILSRTEEILKSKWKELEQELVKLEKERGIEGYYSLEDGLNKEEVQETEQSLKESINQLNQSISDKKSDIAPLIRELKPLKRTVQDLQIEFDKKKSLCNSIAADLETTIGQLEMNLKTLANEKNSLKSNLFRINIEMEITNVYQDIIHQEMKYYVSTSEEDKAKSFL
jgi:PREDICTED: carnitine deficiency-associated gene expressed in ventricle 1-like